MSHDDGEFIKKEIGVQIKKQPFEVALTIILLKNINNIHHHRNDR